MAVAKDLEKNGFIRSYRRIVMYEDLNAAGTIFGGKLVSWIDEASAIYAGCQMNARRIVTKKISELVFSQPARLGDMLEVWCAVTAKGKTSLTVKTLVLRRSFPDDPSAPGDEASLEDAEICKCDLVFVCVDQDGKPKVWNTNK